MSDNLLQAQIEDMENILLAPDFSQSITITPHDGNAFALPGLFEDPAQDVSPATARIANKQPMLHLAVSMLARHLARPLTSADRITVNGQLYQMQELLPDGAGFRITAE